MLVGKRGAFGAPRGIEIDDEGRLYIADAEEHKVWVLDSFTGELLFEIGGFGAQPGRFDEPFDVALGPGRMILVADAGNARVDAFNRLGSFLFSFDGAARGVAPFRRPTAIACDPRGLFFVADPPAGRVVVTDPRGVPLGEISGAGLKTPVGLAFDGETTLFVSDAESNEVRSFRVILDEAAGD